jgi:ABC-2 type transport system permease protein
MTQAIQTTGICKIFGSQTVLNGIDLSIGRGEIFGLLGPSGAGKTTLIKILTGQLMQDSGSASIGGNDTRSLTGDARRRFGITMDNFGVYDRLSCYDNLKIIAGIFRKQLSDTLKNKSVLIQFLMFPVLVIIMETAIKIEGMPEHFFAELFAVMFIGMAPLTSMAAIIAEEKEKNTLRVLLMSNVRPAEYLIGVGAYVFAMCSAGLAVFAVVGGYSGASLIRFIAVMSAGILLSELTGAVIGLFSRNQMTATSISVPEMMIFAFLPMLSMFNDTIKKVAQVTYSQQISELIHEIGSSEIRAESLIVIAVNFVLAVLLLGAEYQKKGLE